jgi:hypothetical protein
MTGVLVWLLLAAAIFACGVALGALARRRRADRRLPTLTDREVADALAPFGADISIWPSRAPRNGSSYENAE